MKKETHLSAVAPVASSGAPRPQHEFRCALGMFPTGVAVITARTPAGNVGLTCNSFSSVSLDPPLILWSLAKRSLKMADFLEASHFGVSILASDQEPLSRRFASSIEDRFSGVSVLIGETGVPLIDGAAAHFECARECAYEGGDHLIFLGRVASFAHNEYKAPLVFHGGAYRMLASPPEERHGELRGPALACARS